MKDLNQQLSEIKVVPVIAIKDARQGSEIGTGAD